MSKQLNYLQQVQTGIDFIEANLDTSISAQQIAERTGISQWHFQRIFKALTNETLKTYIRSRRMANALDKLLSTDSRILDIAIDAGYESQEAFTRSFKQAFEMTPNEYRKIGNRNLFLKKVKINQDYLRHIHQNLSLQPEIVSLPDTQLVGLKTHFYGIDSDKNNIAEKLPPLWHAFLQRLNDIPYRTPGLCYGIVQSVENELLEYHAATPVSTVDRLPEGMVSLWIPATSYACFTHKGKPDQLNATVDYIYSNWLMHTEYRHSYGPDLEIYGRDYEAESADSVMHYAIPLL